MSISPPNNMVVDIDRIKSKLYNNDIDCDSIKYDKVRVDIVSSVDPNKIWDFLKNGCNNMVQHLTNIDK